MLKDLVESENLQAENSCGGCGSPIRDRFYLLAADRAWHGQCLRCCKCSQPLDTEFSCFAREGNIYCKEDYFRLFSLRRCARCGTGLSSSEMVMRARELIFHVDCFSCALCGLHLNAGDTAAIRAGRILCGEHYNDEILSESNLVSTTTSTTTATQFFSGSTQKGRPRKKKTLVQLSNESSDILDRGSTPMGMDLTTYETSQSPSSIGSLSSQTRAKRMRTSFKHHQLRTMKSYFAINQNPDAKDLKQLAQKTGLSKRVLQVWFQNARAKWRRNVMRHESNPNQITPDNILHSNGQPIGHENLENRLATIHSIEEIHNTTFADMY